VGAGTTFHAVVDKTDIGTRITHGSIIAGGETARRVGQSSDSFGRYGMTTTVPSSAWCTRADTP
jgi:CO dehydrogenase/acetyl-CoA synthase gamma subunit (corrinoid Fe-S protein)